MTMQFEIRQAHRKGKHARWAIIGPSGSGKTYTALLLAKGLTRNGRIVVIDTERGSADNYSDILGDVKFDKVDLPNFSPAMYAECIKYVVAQGYDTVITDSLSHAWAGKGGALEMVDKAARKSQSGNSFTAWRDVNPVLAELNDVILSAPAHMLVTMRVKQEYVQEKNDKGKTEIRKVGMAPIQREGLEYEFDIVGNMDMSNNMMIDKTRVAFLSGEVYNKPGVALGKQVREWYDGNDPAPDTKYVEVIEEPIKNLIEEPSKLQRVGGMMKRKNLSLLDLAEAGFENPRGLDDAALDRLLQWLEEKNNG